MSNQLQIFNYQSKQVRTVTNTTKKLILVHVYHRVIAQHAK